MIRIFQSQDTWGKDPNSLPALWQRLGDLLQRGDFVAQRSQLGDIIVQRILEASILGIITRLGFGVVLAAGHP